MALAYFDKDQAAAHFVFYNTQMGGCATRTVYVDLLLESLKFCQLKKGLEIYTWAVISNHCHLAISAKDENLSVYLGARPTSLRQPGNGWDPGTKAGKEVYWVFGGDTSSC